MAAETNVILGISLGANSSGIAIIRENELVEWRIISSKGKWTRHKKGKIISILERVITTYEVTEIALKRPHPYSSSIQVKQLALSTKEMIKAKKLKFTATSLSQIKKTFGNETKSSLIDLVSNKFPQLKNDWDKERISGNPYYIKMFEAVLCAECSLR